LFYLLVHHLSQDRAAWWGRLCLTPAVPDQGGSRRRRRRRRRSFIHSFVYYINWSHDV